MPRALVDRPLSRHDQMSHRDRLPRRLDEPAHGHRGDRAACGDGAANRRHPPRRARRRSPGLLIHHPGAGRLVLALLKRHRGRGHDRGHPRNRREYHDRPGDAVRRCRRRSCGRRRCPRPEVLRRPHGDCGRGRHGVLAAGDGHRDHRRFQPIRLRDELARRRDESVRRRDEHAHRRDELVRHPLRPGPTRVWPGRGRRTVSGGDPRGHRHRGSAAARFAAPVPEGAPGPVGSRARPNGGGPRAAIRLHR